MLRTTTLSLLLSLATAFAGTDKAPDWAMELSTRAIPAYGPEVHSVYLLRERHVTVAPDGTQLHQTREAVRVLTREGAPDARAVVPYIRKAKNVRELHAWLITKEGSVKEFRKDAITDLGAKENFELYSDQRVKTVAAQNPPDNSTFIWEAESVESAIRSEDDFSFQDKSPALVSRYVLTLPPGWKPHPQFANHAPVQPQVDGNTFSWTLQSLNAVKDEQGSPNYASLVPRIGVSYSATEHGIPTWTDVSLWFTPLEKDQATTSPEMTAAVQELTRSQADAVSKIRAIGSYVQKLKYVEIAIDLERGGGYQPHLATDVFKKQYGDCKDKANLMRAMLRIAGLQSYLVAIYSGDRYHVQPNWVDADSFNHVILAISVPDSVSGSTVLAHPTLGRLFLFDPTDQFTPVGDLPADEQGSYAMVSAGGQGGLIQVPSSQPEANKTEVRIEATVNERGALTAKAHFEAKAQSALLFRPMNALLAPADFRKKVEGWIAYNVRDLTVDKMDAKDDFAGGRFDLTVEFTAPSYAQNMQGRLLVIGPSVVHPFHHFAYQKEQRVNPLILDAECYHKETRIKLPAGYKVDEMPDPAHFETKFGTYKADYKLEGDQLVFTEELDVSAATLTAGEYADARTFFEHVAGAEQAPLVLAKN